MVIFLVVYVDVLIILNTLVNYFILLAVRKITRSYTKRWRIAVGALVGGVSSLLLFLEYLGLLMTLLKLITAVLTVVVTFGLNPFKEFMKRLFFLFAITFIFGGFALAVYMFFDKDILIYSNGIIYFDIDMTFLIICSVVSYLLITIILRFTDKKAPKSKEYVVTINNNGKSITCTAFMDTGNNLRDPFSGYPVIMAEKSIFNYVYNDERIRLIPVVTVNGESLIRVFRPESVKINEYTTEKVYIGESALPLEEYKIILNINLEGDMQYE